MQPETFAASTRALLNEDWRRYRNFGVYWWFVKALLKRFYDRHAMPILGDYEPADAAELLPAGGDWRTLLEQASETYRANAALNLNRNRVEDSDGSAYILLDPDIEG
jgi:hypothetical protein